MSLDVSLNKKVYDNCPHCDGKINEKDECLFEANITHNLTKMADKAGLYNALWRPEVLNATKGSDLIIPLFSGLQQLKEKPEYFKQFNPENGWGNYEGLVSFTEKYLEACKENPQAEIHVSR